MANPSPSRPSSVLPYKTQNLRHLYKIGRKLGQGQFGTTYLCVDKDTGKEYACKSIPKRKLFCKEDYEDVWREITIMHHLSEHRNVVQIKGAYEDALFVHLVMELCAGGELFDRIVQKGHYSERKAAHLIKTIVGVVEACHSLGVISPSPHLLALPPLPILLSLFEMASASASLFLSPMIQRPKTLTFSSSLLPRFSILSSPRCHLSMPRVRHSSAVRNVALSSDVDVEEEEGASVRFSEDLKLFVGNLPFSVDSAELAGLFGQAGNVEMVEVIYDKLTGRSRGFGFVTMSTVEEVEAAAQQFNGYELGGRALRVNSGPPPRKSDSPREFRDREFRSGSNNSTSTRVYVGNLSWGVDDSALESLFSEHGNVVEAKVVYDRESGRSRGFGFVTFNSSDEVNRAISSLNGVELDGRSIRVTVAEPRPRRQF